MTTKQTLVQVAFDQKRQQALQRFIERRDMRTVCPERAMRVPEDPLLGWLCDHLLKGMRPSPNRC